MKIELSTLVLGDTKYEYYLKDYQKVVGFKDGNKFGAKGNAKLAELLYSLVSSNRIIMRARRSGMPFNERELARAVKLCAIRNSRRATGTVTSCAPKRTGYRPSVIAYDELDIDNFN